MSYNFTIKKLVKIYLKKYNQINYFNYASKNKVVGNKGKGEN